MAGDPPVDQRGSANRRISHSSGGHTAAGALSCAAISSGVSPFPLEPVRVAEGIMSSAKTRRSKRNGDVEPFRAVILPLFMANPKLTFAINRD